MMFKSNGEGEFNDSSSQDDTIIGQSIKIEGDLVSNGNIIVEGQVTGNVKTEKDLKVGSAAKVSADVNAQNAQVSGRVDGNIVISGKLELAESAEVNGDMEVGTLEIAGGAKFNGKCTMNGASAPISTAKTQEKKQDKEDDLDELDD